MAHRPEHGVIPANRSGVCHALRTLPLWQFSLARYCGTSVFAAALVFALVGCATRQTETFQSGRPVFDPCRYFQGSTHSWGVLESGSGHPKEILTTRTQGYWDGNEFHFEQDISFEKGRREHRSWQLQRVDAHHYTATGTDIVGVAHAEAYGNVLHLEFTLDVSPGNPLLHVHMSQWMFLQPDGRTMINCDTLTKAGVVVARLAEQFQKDAL